ncbi:flagellar biosynthetic protein FliO [Virgibacillus sp. W0430]|uniref:flagellar biosynthetic protein FliO n=1 Tax=Virgibacillus sp. W0430 TaxID=3391580 RepID=UPI003F487F37
MRKKTCLIALSLFCFTIIGLFWTVPSDASNVKDCLDGTADCKEMNSPANNEIETETIEGQPKTDGKGSLVFDIIKMGVALLIVLGLIYALLKLLNKRNKLYEHVKAMENLGGISVGQNKSIQIVRIGSALYVVGVGDNVELLKEITDEATKKEFVSNTDDRQSNPTAFISQLFHKEQPSQTEKFKHLFTTELDKLKKNRKEIVNQQKKDDEHDGIY